MPPSVFSVSCLQLPPFFPEMQLLECLLVTVHDTLQNYFILQQILVLEDTSEFGFYFFNLFFFLLNYYCCTILYVTGVQYSDSQFLKSILYL